MKFNIERSTTINAPMAKVRALVEDFNHWNSWSPWTVCEPGCSVSVSGKVAEAGHSMSWEGQVIGAGKNTLVKKTDSQLDYDLEFFKPWKSQADVRFKFEEVEGKTRVTWLMDSSMPFFMFFMIKSLKNMIAMDYDRGLKMLKAMVEEGKVNAETLNNETVDYQGFSYVGIQRTLPFDEMAEAMRKDFEQIVAQVVIKGQQSAMHWVCIYPKFDTKNMMVTYIAAISDENVGGLDLGSEYVSGEIKNSKALEVKHNGAYDFLGNAWAMGMMTMQAKKMKAGGHPFEQYWNSPMETPPDELKTSIYFPLKG